MFIQDLSQIKDLYERWSTLIANCSVRMAFGTNDVETAKTLSDMLGTTTITVTGTGSTESSVLQSMNLWKRMIGGGKNINLSDTSRALMTPDEVMRLPFDSQLIFVQGTKPVVAEKIMYFKDPYFKGKFDVWKG
jgi:type IV secretion system protein VirD4